jgi:hypothetical protein
MKLWLLEAKGAVDYDEFDAYVIRAEDEEGARKIAAEKPGASGPKKWLNPRRSICTELTADGEPGLILGSFNAG